MELPIRINMGTTNPRHKSLGRRELYLYNNNGVYELWVGADDDKNTASYVTTVEAVEAKSVNTESNMLKTKDGIVAGMQVKLTTTDDNGNTVNDVNISPIEGGNATLESVNLVGLKQISVAENMYGETLPTEGEPGQIFFKI